MQLSIRTLFVFYLICESVRLAGVWPLHIDQVNSGLPATIVNSSGKEFIPQPSRLADAGPIRDLSTTLFPPLVIRPLKPKIRPLQQDIATPSPGRMPTIQLYNSCSLVRPCTFVLLSCFVALCCCSGKSSSLRQAGILVVLLSPVLTTRLEVYDTSGRFSNQTVTMKIISLLTVGNCDEASTQSYLPPETAPVQVLRLPMNTPIEVTQCLISYTVVLSHCSSNIFRSDIYPPTTLVRNRILVLNNEECLKIKTKKMHSFVLYGKKIEIMGFTSSKQSFSETILGTVQDNGGCQGVAAQIGSETRPSAVVTVHLDYAVKKHVGLFHMESSTITLGDWLQLQVGSSGCDSEEGCFAFNSAKLPRTRCEKVQELYEGSSRLHRPNRNPNYSPIITISNAQNGQGVSVTLSHKIVLCKREIYATNIEGIYINILSTNQTTHEKVHHRLSNSSYDISFNKNENRLLDILGSISTIYLESTLNTAQQFSKLATSICELKRTDILLMLSDLSNLPAPSLLNYRLGLLFKRAASVVYIYQGVPLTARLRPVVLCFEEIPIFVTVAGGEEIEAFATSKARLIVLNGTEISCDSGKPMHYIPHSEEPEGALVSHSDGLLFPSQSLLSPSNTPGMWLCQDSSGFHACTVPTTLTPTNNQEFFAIPEKYLRSSLFGSSGRIKLYTAQTEGHARQVMISRWRAIFNGEIQATARDSFLNNLDSKAISMLQQQIFPVMAFIFGDTFFYLEKVLLIVYSINVLFSLIALIGRLKNLIWKYGCSGKLFLALSAHVYSAFIPWHKIKNNAQKMKEENKLEVERLEGIIRDHVNRLDLFMLKNTRHMDNLVNIP